jgi:serine protease Do
MMASCYQSFPTMEITPVNDRSRKNNKAIALARQHHRQAMTPGQMIKVWLLAAATLVIAFSFISAASARGAPDSFADLAERLLPAVVNISTTQVVQQRQKQKREVPMPQFPPGSPFEDFFKDFFDRQERGEGNDDGKPRSRRATSLGSGFIIDPSGIVITNNHVIAEADEINVILTDGTKLVAKLIGTDPKTDIAVLQVKPEKPLPHVSFGSSRKARVGDWVMAIGNPFGLGGSVTAGIISARARNINAGPYDDFIQTDASINRGNSGGPLFNMDGEVIGINTAIFSPTGGSVGIGFSVPSDMARTVVSQLREFGRTRRGWLGVRIQPVSDEIAESLGLDGAKGALVASVFDDGPAREAGILAGDVILKFDNKVVPHVRQLPRIVADTVIGKDIDVEVWRKGEIVKLQVQVGELKEEKVVVAKAKAGPEADTSTIDALGMTLSSMTDDLRKRFEVREGVAGVVVTKVETDSAAAEKGIRPGDIIVEVGQEEVSSPDEVVDKVTAVQESKRKSVLILLQRAEDLRFVALRLKES